MLLGRETIYRDGVPVGWLGSGGFGYTVGRGIGYGYVRHPGIDRDWLLAGSTSSRSRPSGSRPTCTWPLSTIRTPAASGSRLGLAGRAG